MTQIDFPFRIDRQGRSAVTEQSDHIRDLIEQVLFTSPGERVNRPDFGAGLLQLVFAPNSEEIQATTQFLVQGNLQRWLGELIEVEAVEVKSREEKLEVVVQYVVRRTRERQKDEFSREVSQ